MSKRGRTPSYAKDRNGDPVVGLSIERKSGRHYITGTKTYLGRDFDIALMKFRHWEAAQRKDALIPVRASVTANVRLPIEHDGPVLQPSPYPDRPVRTVVAEAPKEWKTTEPGIYDLVTEDAFFAKVRQLILTKPTFVAERTGIPQLACLADLKQPEKSLTLSQVERAYFDRKKPMSTVGACDRRRHWAEFVKIVGVKTVREITITEMERFHDHVWAQAKKKKWSSSSIRHRLDCPKAFFRAAIKKRKDVEQLQRVVDLTGIFERPAAANTDPRPLSREDVHTLLNAAPAKLHTALLLALNLACYPSEVAVIKKSELDLDSRTFVSRRSKTGVVRIGVLWVRTIAAVRRYLEEEPHGGETLFVNSVGTTFKPSHLTRLFRKIRATAGLDNSVTFDRVRDSAYTRAVEASAPLDQAKMLAGHKMPGISDAYLKRSPRMVADACKAIEDYYFGVRMVSDDAAEHVA